MTPEEPMTDNRLTELQIDAHHPSEVYELTNEVVRLRVEIERLKKIISDYRSGYKEFI